MRSISIVIALLLAPICGNQWYCQADEPELWLEVRGAIEARRTNLSLLKCKIHGDVVRQPYQLIDDDTGLNHFGTDPLYTRMESLLQLAIDMRSFRIETYQQIPHVSNGTLLDDFSVCVFDGSSESRMYPRRVVGENRSRVHLYRLGEFWKKKGSLLSRNNIPIPLQFMFGIFDEESFCSGDITDLGDLTLDWSEDGGRITAKGRVEIENNSVLDLKYVFDRAAGLNLSEFDRCLVVFNGKEIPSAQPSIYRATYARFDNGWRLRSSTAKHPNSEAQDCFYHDWENLTEFDAGTFVVPNDFLQPGMTVSTYGTKGRQQVSADGSLHTIQGK